jgi:hypothetical protein
LIAAEGLEMRGIARSELEDALPSMDNITRRRGKGGKQHRKHDDQVGKI